MVAVVVPDSDGTCSSTDCTVDDDCRNCSEAFRFDSSPCCCNGRTVTPNRANTWDRPVRSDGIRSWADIRAVLVWQNLVLCQSRRLSAAFCWHPECLG